MTRFQRLGLSSGTIALVTWLAACSPEQRDDGSQGSPGPQFRLVTLQLPIAWRTSTRGLLVARRDRWVSADVAKGSCKGTGLYTVAPSGRLQLWRAGTALCDVLLWSAIPQVSPDGQWLLFASPTTENALSRLNLDDRREIVIRRDCLPASSSPAWSPDGRRIAYVANCTDRSRPVLHVMNSDGSASRAVGDLAGDSASEADPTWSPDGRAIAVGRRSGAAGRSDVVVVDTRRGTRRVAVTGGRAPAWSPAGDWIAYLTDDSTLVSPQIRLVRPDGREDHLIFALADTVPRQIVSAPLVWSPGGRRIAFSRVYEGGSDIFIVGVDRRLLRAVTK